MSLDVRTHHIGMSGRLPGVARAEIAADQNSQFCTPQRKIIEDPAYAPDRGTARPAQRQGRSHSVSSGVGVRILVTDVAEVGQSRVGEEAWPRDRLVAG